MSRSTALPAATPVAMRDLRIDLFRGIALAMIFVNHMPSGHWQNATLRAWGFSDAAEVFVLLAGIASALAYSRWFERGEMALGTMAVTARIWKIYLMHLMLFLLVGAIVIYASESLNEPTYLETLGFDVFLRAPSAFLGHVLTLTFHPTYLDILPLYIVLLASLPLVFLLDRTHWLLPLAASALVYGAAQLLPLNLPNTKTAREWFFNPAAWQFLFVIGFTIGRRMQGRKGFSMLDDPAIRQSLTAAALGFTLIAFMMAAPWRSVPGLENMALFQPGAFGHISKNNLHPLRLVDILLKAWLVVVLVPAGASWLHSRWMRPFIIMGKHSLEVFSLSTALAIAGGIAITLGGMRMNWITGIISIGLAAMILLAWCLEWQAQRAGKVTRARSLPSDHTLAKPAGSGMIAPPPASHGPA